MAKEGNQNATKILLVIGGIVAVLVIVLVAIFGLLINQDNSIEVRDQNITNVTDTALTVTWRSVDPSIGMIYYIPADQSWPAIFSQTAGEVAYDDRDVELDENGEYVQVEGGAQERYTHHVTLRDLDPNTSYKIRVGGVINGKEPEVAEVMTQELVEELNVPDPGYGEVEGADTVDSYIIFNNKSAEEADFISISAPIADNGTYSVDLNAFETEDLDASALVPYVYSGDSAVTTVEFPAVGYKPFPTISMKEVESSETNGNELSEEVLQAVNAQIAQSPANCGGDIGVDFAQASTPYDASIDARSRINVRIGPSTTDTVVGGYNDGQRVRVFERVIEADGSHCWFRTRGNSASGWVRGDLIVLSLPNLSTTPQGDTDSNIATEAPDRSTSPVEGIGNPVNLIVTPKFSSGTNLRSAPASRDENGVSLSNVVGFLTQGSEYQVVGEVTGENISGNSKWYMVELDDGTRGYASAAVTNIIRENTVATTNGDVQAPSTFQEDELNNILQATIVGLNNYFATDNFGTINFGTNCARYERGYDIVSASATAVDTSLQEVNDVLDGSSDGTQLLTVQNLSREIENWIEDNFPEEVSRSARFCVTRGVDLGSTNDSAINVSLYQDGLNLPQDDSNISSQIIAYFDTLLAYHLGDNNRSVKDETSSYVDLIIDNGFDYEQSSRDDIINNAMPQAVSFGIQELERLESDGDTEFFTDEEFNIIREIARQISETDNGIAYRQAIAILPDTSCVEGALFATNANTQACIGVTSVRRCATGYSLIRSRGHSLNTPAPSMYSCVDYRTNQTVDGFVRVEINDGTEVCVATPVPLNLLDQGTYYYREEATCNFERDSVADLVRIQVKMLPASSRCQETTDNIDSFTVTSVEECESVLDIYQRSNCFPSPLKSSGSLDRYVDCEDIQTETYSNYITCVDEYVSNGATYELVGGKPTFNSINQYFSCNYELSNTPTTNPIDTEPAPGTGLTGNVLDGSILGAVNAQETGEEGERTEVSESGRYVFFQDGELVAEREIIVPDGETVEIQLFDDANGNGVRDEGEEQFANNQFSLELEATAESYSLNSGWNLVHIPMVDTRDNPIRSAQDLINHWNGQGADLIHVARFNNNKFTMFTQRENADTFDGDFNLSPGEPVFVFNRGENVDVSFSGQRVNQNLPLSFVQGWNLVGFITPEESYNSEEMLNNLEAKGEGLDISTLSQFENGSYQSIVEEDDLVFGNNFNLVDKRGYFVRVESGGGQTVTP